MKRHSWKTALQKATAVLFAVLLTLSALPTAVFAEGFSSVTLPNDAVSEEDTLYIEVASGQDLYNLVYLLSTSEDRSVYIQQTADIDMEGMILPQIRYTASPLCYDGGGYTISNLTGEYGLFFSLGKNCTLRDIHFVGARIEGELARGLLVASAGDGLVVTHCTADATSSVTSLGTVTAGALVGSIATQENGRETVFSYCVNEATVTGNGTVGGLVGRVAVMNFFRMFACVNKGEVSSGGVNTVSVGGLIGDLNLKGTQVGGFVIDHCYQTGLLQCAETDRVFYMGGIVGRIAGSEASGRLTHCYDHSQRSYTLYSEANCHNAALIGYVGLSQGPMAMVDCYAANGWKNPNPFDRLYTLKDVDFIFTQHCGIVGSTDRFYLSDGAYVELYDMMRLIDAMIAVHDMSLEGSGAANDPFLISSAEDWLAFADYMRATATVYREVYAELTDDIDFKGVKCSPIPAKNTLVNLNGNDHTVYDLTMEGEGNLALFERTALGSSFYNLHFVGASLKATGNGQSVGVLIAEAVPGLSLLNVTVDETSVIGSQYALYAGGLVGRIVEGEEEADVAVAYCLNSASVTAMEAVGGIIGDVGGLWNLSFACCVNAGTLKVVGKGMSPQIGGILGAQGTDTGTSEYVDTETSFTQCLNFGELCSVNSSQIAMGGIVGGIRGARVSPRRTSLVMEHCYDYSLRTVPPLEQWEIENYLTWGQDIGGLIGYDDSLKRTVRDSYVAAHPDSVFPVKDIHSVALKNGETDGNGQVITTVANAGMLSYSALKPTTDALLDMIHTNHVYGGGCDEKCNVCGRIRTADNSRHSYSSPCDGACDACGFLRADTAAHSYSGACDEICNLCDERARKALEEHTYAHSCSASCSVCGADNPRADSHWTYFDCDTACYHCGAEVTPRAEHEYWYECSTTCRYCKRVTRAEGTEEHFRYADCAEHCNRCDEAIEPQGEHLFEGEGCKIPCSKCHDAVQESHEVVGFPCAPKCDRCGNSLAREKGHTYLDELDFDCEVCGTVREGDALGKPFPEEDAIFLRPSPDTNPMPSVGEGTGSLSDLFGDEDVMVMAPDVSVNLSGISDSLGCSGMLSGSACLFGLCSVAAFLALGKKKDE